MTAYQYIAVDKSGKKQKGVAEADSARLLREQLRAQGLLPLEVTVVDSRATAQDNLASKSRRALRRRRISKSDLTLVTRQMATLLTAGIPIDEMLHAVSQQTEKQRVKAVLLGVRSRVLEGYSFAASLQQFPNAFPKLYRTTVASGEKSGKLDQILERLADYTERQHRLRQKVMQAMIYPSVMTAVSIAVVIFLLVYVVPKIVDVFNQTHQTLPLATVILIHISSFLSHYGVYLLVAITVLSVLLARLLKKSGFRRRYDALVLKIPLLGRTIRTINEARFGRTFGILTAATVPVLEGMHAAAQLIMPLPMRLAVEHAVDRVREGVSIHFALSKTGYFAPMFIHLVSSGESSGQLESMLQRAANTQEDDVSMVLQNLLTVFEPVLILIMGAIVLFIVLAIMLPIFALDQFN